MLQKQVTKIGQSRSREGAWIEIVNANAALSNSNVAPVRERGLKSPPLPTLTVTLPVAPVRERGLKCSATVGTNIDVGRSREGAWIEMYCD